MQHMIITIDTEGDNLWGWKEGTALTTENAAFVPRFQELCEEHGFIPTYMTTYEMAMEDRWVRYAKKKQQEGKVLLMADQRGMFRVNTRLLREINAIGDITICSLPDHYPVEAMPYVTPLTGRFGGRDLRKLLRPPLWADKTRENALETKDKRDRK